MSGYARLFETLTPVGFPLAPIKYTPRRKDDPLPDAYIVYQCIYGDESEHYEGKAFGNRIRYSVKFYTRKSSILETSFDQIETLLLAAGFLAVPGGRDAFFPETGHYSRQRDYNFYEEVKFNA